MTLRAPPALFVYGGLCLVLLLVGIHSRPLLPIDETRYITVAWEMWLRGDYLVPYLNGAPYSHKPPLLFWLIQCGWALFGVNAWTPRLLTTLFSVGGLWLLARVARLLWPEDEHSATLAPLVLLGCLCWSLFTSALMFDMLVAVFTLLGLLGVLRAWRGGTRSGWILFGVAIGLGILAKGPVILLYTLPVALLAPWWMQGENQPRWASWYRGLGAGVALGALIALAWAIPAAYWGGEEYRNAILWKQTAGRMVESFAHRRPWWWYLPLLPFVLFPWIAWPAFWRGLPRIQLDAGLRFCLVWCGIGFAALALVSGKQVHYLLPLLPAFALIVSRATRNAGAGRFDDGWPAAVVMVLGILLSSLGWLSNHIEMTDWLAELSPLWGIALIGLGLLFLSPWLRKHHRRLEKLTVLAVALVVIANLSFQRFAWRYYDMAPAGRYLAGLQRQGIDLLHGNGGYQGQFQFAGRLKQPIAVLPKAEIAAWAAAHLDGRVITYPQTLTLEQLAKAEYYQPYKGGYLAVWPSRALLQDPILLKAIVGRRGAEGDNS
ncbi:MAG: glycosyltransferase family 39 protein [Gammaproteobacteria bacterium]